jgi:hypothetical protein
MSTSWSSGLCGSARSVAAVPPVHPRLAYPARHGVYGGEARSSAGGQGCRHIRGPNSAGAGRNSHSVPAGVRRVRTGGPAGAVVARRARGEAPQPQPPDRRDGQEPPRPPAACHRYLAGRAWWRETSPRRHDHLQQGRPHPGSGGRPPRNAGIDQRTGEACNSAAAGRAWKICAAWQLFDHAAPRRMWQPTRTPTNPNFDGLSITRLPAAIAVTTGISDRLTG